ncbi:MAG: cache domain-containing protein [bacterium]
MKLKIIGLFMICITIVIVYYTLLYFNKFKDSIIHETQQQLLVTARSTVKGMEQYIRGYSDSLKVLARNPHFQQKVYKKNTQSTKNKGYYYRLYDFYRVHKSNIKMVSALDADGTLLQCYPVNNKLNGKSYSIYPSVKYVLKKRKSHVSEVFKQDGQFCVYILEPVFYKKKFVGILRCTISMDALFNRFILPIMNDNQGYAWIFDNRDNIIIAHPQKELIGKSVKDIINMDNTKKNLIESIMKEKYDNLTDIKGKNEGYGIFKNNKIKKACIMAFRRVEVGKGNWNLIISNDYSKNMGSVNKFAIHIFGPGLLLLLFCMEGFSLYFREKMGI